MSKVDKEIIKEVVEEIIEEDKEKQWEAFKLKRKMNNIALENRLKGQTVWESSINGPYVKTRDNLKKFK